MLDLESLHIFTVAAETENFTRSAQRLHLSQPAVSQHIQALEQQLGLELFVRNGRRISLSPAGEALLPLVQDLMRTCRQVEDAAHALAGEVAGQLTLGCSTSSGKYLVPRILARLRERYPLVRAAVKVGPRSQVLDWLQAGVVDVAVTSDRVQRAGLHFRRFFEDEIVLIAPGDHPWALRRSIAPKELYQERFVLRESSSGTQMTLIDTLDQFGVDYDRLETVLVLDNSEAILMAVEEHIGLGFVPKVTAQRHLTASRIKIVEIDGVAMKRWLYLVDNAQVAHSPAANAFWAFMDEQATLADIRPPQSGAGKDTGRSRLAIVPPATTVEVPLLPTHIPSMPQSLS
jgi:DNA-binding transcriptional LysR family regulator